MRLTTQEQKGIKHCVSEVFGKKTRVYLFGSRVDDHKKGGDIDLLIESDNTEAQFEKKVKLLGLLHDFLGEQKIDIVIAYDKTRLVEQEARKTGILL